MNNLKTFEYVVLLVNIFYEKVQKDKTSGNLFNTIAKVDWESHLTKNV